MPDDVDVDALIDQARKPEKTVTVCLRGDLIAEIEEREQQIARMVADDRVASQRARLGDEIDELRRRMQAASITLRFRALDRLVWADLEAKHPPRKDEKTGEVNRYDAGVGFNVDTLIAEAIPMSLAAPKLTPAQLDKLLAAATNQQYDEIAGCIHALNCSRVTVPFSVLASAARESSGENSKQPEPGVSPDDGSTGGSRDERLATPTTTQGD